MEDDLDFLNFDDDPMIPMSRGCAPSTYNSEASVNTFIRALREALRADKSENNCFRWLLEHDPNAPIEKIKEYLPRPNSTVGLLAITEVIAKHYEVEQTYSDVWSDMEPVSEMVISTSYNKTATVYEQGVIELINPTTGNRLTVQIETETNAPYYKVYSLEGNKETDKFLRHVIKRIRTNSLYKNKTLALEFGYSGILVPKFIKPANVGKEDVVVGKEIAEIIQSNVVDVFLRAEEYKVNKIPTKRGVLLEGPPGCGKSKLVKYINNTLEGKVTFIYVTDGVIRGASDISTIFSLARKYQPTVLVFEDIDTIGFARGTGGNSNFTSELLAQLDGLESLDNFVIVATTNHADLIDDALKNRPSRFDRRLVIDVPLDKQRGELINIFCRERDVEISAEDITVLANLTKKFSGAQLQEVVITAKMLALNKNCAVSLEDLKTSIDFVRKQFHDSKISSTDDSVGFRKNRT
jgi:SpoVK/Ycf46/Vps4 family AAA+-type ATPase